MLSLFRAFWRWVRSLFGAEPKGKPRRLPKTTPQNDDRIRIAYAPSLDGDADPGEVVWTWVAYEEDPSRGKDRPVLIVGTRGRSLVGVPLTSQHKPRSPQVSVGEGPWDRERRTSYARVDRLIDVDPRRVRREGAIMPRDRFDAVVRAAREWHGSAVFAPAK